MRGSIKKSKENQPQMDYTVKCIVIGDSGVGKTCILNALDSGKPVLETQPTVEAVYKNQTIKIDDRSFHLHVWDTAGQETFQSITRIYYRGATCAALVYDLSNRRTFQSIPKWIKDLQSSTNPAITKILIANKSDIKQRAVTREEGEELANEYDMRYMETSVISQQNIKEIFPALIKSLDDRIKTGELVPQAETNGIKLGSIQKKPVNGTKPAKSGGCACSVA